MTSIESRINLGNMHDQDICPIDEFEQAQDSGLELDEDGWPIVFKE